MCIKNAKFENILVRKKIEMKLKGKNIFGSLEMANYGLEIVVGTGEYSLG